jgi:hypothetical protein
LNAHDKHRRIQPVLAAPVSGEVRHAPPVDCVRTRIPTHARRETLKVDAEINRVYVRKTGPNPDIQMKTHLAVKPLLNNRYWLDDWLDVTANYIGELLGRFSAPPAQEILKLKAAHDAASPSKG